MFRGFRRGTKGGPKGGKEGLSRGNTGSKNVLQSGRNVIKLIFRHFFAFFKNFLIKIGKFYLLNVIPFVILPFIILSFVILPSDNSTFCRSFL